MDLKTFEKLAQQEWEKIPARHREGVVALIVDRERKADPDLPDTPRLGECAVDPAIELVVDAPMRSIIHLYYGSFVWVASEEPDFDWHDEIRETIRHELRHHLEWSAGHDALGVEDDLQLENARRLRGEPFDRAYYRFGETVDRGIFVVDGDAFIELDVRPRDWERVFTSASEVRWRGWVLTAPPAGDEERPHDVVFVPIEDGWDELADADERPEDWLDVTFVFRKRWRLFGRHREPLLTWKAP